MFGSSILKSNFFYHQALKCDNILKEILVSLLYFFTLSQVNENFNGNLLYVFNFDSARLELDNFRGGI